ncbi:tektin-2-like [Lepisosteus oculatus]|uniref:tektin-2-like n=1 Tax=Lepisosteus oculatus TaxID=7918 RepID=UPI0035F514F2
MATGFKKPSPRYTHSDWTASSRVLIKHSEQLRDTANKIIQDVKCTMEEATIQNTWVQRNTQRNLCSRMEELTQWNEQIGNCIDRLDRELGCLEKVKIAAEECLQERLVYLNIVLECFTLRDVRQGGDLIHDPFEAQLKKEKELCESMKELFQKKIFASLNQLRSLSEIRKKLAADYQDTAKAVKLNGQCLSFDPKSPAVGYKCHTMLMTKDILSYEEWAAHCDNLKKTGEKEVAQSALFRGDLEVALSKAANMAEAQHSATEFALRKRLHELNQAKDNLEWEKQHINDTISELVKEIQNLDLQIQNTANQIKLSHTRLETLSHRSNAELCKDQPHIGLLHETEQLERNVFSLKKKIVLSQNVLKEMLRHLSHVEDELCHKTRSIEIDTKCQEIRRNLLPLRRNPAASINRTEYQLSPLNSWQKEYQ